MSGIPPSCSYRKDYHFFVLKTESVIWASFRKQGSEKSLKNHPPTDSPKIHIPLPYENVGEIRWSLKTWTQKWYEYWRLPAGKVRKMYNHKSWLETTNLDLGWIKEYVHQADLDICTLKNCHLFGGCSFCFHWICHWEHTATSACTLLCFQRPHVEAPLDAESNWSWDHEMRSEKFRVTTVKRLLTSAEEK